MIITGFELTNFGPHEHLKAETPERVVAILGPNGRGKTRILKAIEFAFTGDLDQPQKECVCKTAVDKKTGEPVANGSVKLTFRHAGSEGVIFRQVGLSPRRYLEWDGEKITKAADMDRQLGEILNCDKRAISLAVFLTQGNIGSFLFLTPAEREKEYSRMLLIDHLPKVAETIDQELTNVRRLITDHGATLDEVNAGLKQAGEIADLAAMRFNETRDWAPEIDWLNTRANAASALDDRLAEKGAAEASLETAKLKLAETKAPEGLTEEGLDAARERLEKHRAAVPKAESLGVSIRQVESSEARIAELTASLPDVMPATARISEIDGELGKQSAKQAAFEAHKLAQAAAGRARSACEGSDESILSARESVEAAKKALEAVTSQPGATTSREELARLRSRLAVLDKAVEVIAEPRACPVCSGCEVDPEDMKAAAESVRAKIDAALAADSALHGAETALATATANLKSLEDAHPALKTRLGELAGELSSAEAEVARVGTFDPGRTQELVEERAKLAATLGAFTSAKENIRREQAAVADRAPRGLDALRSELAAAQADIMPAGEAKKLGEDISALSAYLRNSQILRQEVVSAEAVLGKAVAAVQEAQRRLKGLEDTEPAELRSLGIPGRPEQIAHVREKQQVRDRLQGELDQAAKALRRQEARLEEVRNLEKNQGNIRELIADMERLKGLFGRNGIQRQYLDEMFGTLAAITAENLSNWESDFMVREDPEKACNFLFCRADNPEIWMDQSQLSGGQRIRLAISFLLGVQRLVFPDLGFLVLDEPSTHLDKEGQEDLREFFRTVAKHLEHQDSQVFVVDHCEDLRPAFQKVIDLP